MKYILILILFISCTKQDIEPVNDIVEDRSASTLVYYANSHLTNMNYPTTPMNVWTATVVFNSNCRYTTVDPDNQLDYNKLFGIRKSPLYLHRNGAYLVWAYEPDNDKIRIGWYLHNDNGGFESMPISESIYVNIGDPVYLYIMNYNSFFVFNLDGQSIYIDKSEHDIDDFTNGWRLNPWTGGQEKQGYHKTISIN